MPATFLRRHVPAALTLLLAVGACTSPSTDSETHHWPMAACDPTIDCGEELACICGVCTLPCDPDDPCPFGRCRSTRTGPGGALCEGLPTPSEGLCLIECDDEGACDTEGETTCSYGICLPPERALSEPPPPTCTLEPTPALGALTDDFEADTDCECTAERPLCHSLFRGGVLDHDEGVVTLEFLKASNTGSVAPSSPIAWRVAAAPADRDPTCLDLDAAEPLAEGIWAETPSLITELDLRDTIAWPPEDGTEIHLYFFTGSGGDPEARTFFQPEALHLRFTCTHHDD